MGEFINCIASKEGRSGQQAMHGYKGEGAGLVHRPIGYTLATGCGGRL